jgi:outer membrane protein
MACWSFLGGLVLSLITVVPSVQATGLIEVYQRALQNDPQFQAARFEHQAATEARPQALAGLLPTLGFSYDYSDTTQDIVSSDNTVFASGSTSFGTTSYTLSLTQPVFRYASIVRLGQSRSEVLRADVQLDVALQELMLRVSEKYLMALASQDQLAFARAEQAADERHFELAQGRVEMGLAPITDLHDAKARLAMVKARTIEAENLLDDALQALREMTGEEIVELATLQRDMALEGPEPAEVAPWVDAALQQNLMLEAQRLAVRVAEKEVARQRAGHYPTLDLIGRYNNNETDGTLFGGGSEVETQELMLQLNIPIYEGGMVNSRTRQAASLQRKASQELVREVRAVMRQARSAYLGVQSAISRVQALEQAVVSQNLALDAKQEGFRSGLYTGLAVLDAERDLYQAKQDYALARYDYLLNGLRLKQAAGTLNYEDLAQAGACFAQVE